MYIPQICSVLCCLVASTWGDWQPNYVRPEILDLILSTKQYNLFCKMVGIQDVNLVIPREGDHTTEELMQNKNLKLGDILPYPWEEQKASESNKRTARQAIKFSTFPTFKWNKTVPFSISTVDYTQNQRNTILDHIDIFNGLFPNIQFVPRTNQLDYVYFISGNGCFSSLGRTGGPQALSLQSNGCLTTRSILHEMTHAIGFSHEHQRSDRDTYVEVLYQNIPPDFYSQYEKQDPLLFDLINTYDYYSIMHYRYIFPGQDQPSFRILMNGINTNRIGGQNYTNKDVRKINKVYS